MEIMLTTSDNPFDPFNDFDNWFNFDEQKGYHSCSLLARIAETSYGLPNSFNDKEIERAINSIINEIPLNTNDSKAFYVKAIKGKTKFPIKN